MGAPFFICETVPAAADTDPSARNQGEQFGRIFGIQRAVSGKLRIGKAFCGHDNGILSDIARQQDGVRISLPQSHSS